MSEPFLAEIKIVGFNFAPRGFAFCDGQILPINQNQSLFSLLGTTYGGDGRTSFALPDLRSRAPIHVNGSVDRLGSRSGEENHTLTIAEMPSHIHGVNATDDLPQADMPNNNVLASAGVNAYGGFSPPAVNMRADMVANAGGGQAHDNMQPFLTLNFVIALQGLFPSRN